MDTMIQQFTRSYKDAGDAQKAEISVENPFPPYGELANPWETWWDVYSRGKMWGFFKGMPSWKSRPNHNFPFQIVESNTTLLTDNRPAVAPQPVGDAPEDYFLAEALKARNIKWWGDVYGDMKVALGVKYSRVFGLGWWRLDYEKGKGQVWETIHPSQIKVSPDCTIDSFLIREPTYLIYEYESQVGELRKAFPKKGTTGKKRLDWDDFVPGWTPFTTEWDTTREKDDPARLQPTKTCKVYQFWMQDPTTIEWEADISEEEKATLKKQKYPNGRVITIAGGIILDDRPNPYEHGMYPFTPVLAYFMPGRFYPVGDVQGVITGTIMYNRMGQLLFDTTVKAGGGKVLLGAGSNLDPNEWTNDPYQVLACGDANQVKLIQGGEPPRHVYNQMEVIRRDIDDAGGYHDISRGRDTGGRKSASEVQIMADSDRTRVRLAARALKWSLDRLLRMWCFNVAQFESEQEAVFKVAPLPDDDATGIPVPGFEDKPVPVSFKGKDIINGDSIKEGLKYTLISVEFSSVPNAMNTDQQLAMMLHDKGLIDDEELLTRLNYPNARYHAMKAQARKAAAPPQAPPPEMPQSAPQQVAGMHQMPDGSMMPDSEMSAPIEGMPPEVQQMVEQFMAEGMGPDEAIALVMEQMGGA